MTRWLLASIVSIVCIGSHPAHADTSVTREIAKQRGLPIKKAAKKAPAAEAGAATLDRDALRARLAKLAEDPAVQAETRAEGLALARWGLVPVDLDYRAALVALYTDQIDKRAADPAWNDLVTTERAMRDAKFDFAKLLNVPAGEGDAALARRALVEVDGIALLIEIVLARKGRSACGSTTTAIAGAGSVRAPSSSA